MWITWMWGLRDWAVEEIEAKATPESSKATWIWYIRNLTKAWIAWLLVLVWSQNLSTQQQAQAAVPSVSQPNSWPQTIDDLIRLYSPESSNEASWKIEISKLPDPIREDFQKISHILLNSSNLVEYTGWDFVYVRKVDKNSSKAERIANVVYRAWETTITILRDKDLQTLTWMSLADFYKDMDKSLNWMQSAEQLKLTPTWQFLRSIYSKINTSWDKDLLTWVFDTLWRTWTNEIDKKILNPQVFSDFKSIARSNLESLEQRWLLTIDTMYLAIRTAISIAYQQNLEYEFKDDEVVYKWSGAKETWIKLWRNKAIDWRKWLADEEATRWLLTEDNFEAWVYRLTVKANWVEKKVDFKFPLSPNYNELVKQAIAHTVLWKDRWEISTVISISTNDREIVASEQRVWKIDQDIDNSLREIDKTKKQISNDQRETAIMRQYIAITKWKDYKVLVPDLPKIVEMRDEYEKIPWHDPLVLAQYNSTISEITLAKQVADSWINR